MKNTKLHRHTMESISPRATIRRQANGIGWHGVTAWLMPHALPQTGGLKAISRWLSEERAKPPVLAKRPNASRRAGANRRQPKANASKLRWRGCMSWLASLQDADILHTLSGGVAPLNHRLIAGNPSGSTSAI